MGETRRTETLLKTYNDGLGDGLVFATAIMGRAPDKIIQQLRDEIAAKRASLRPLPLQETEK